MNRTIFTLFAGLYLLSATVFSASAQTSPDSRLTLGDPVASLTSGVNSDLYHLRVDSIDFTHSTAALAGTGAGIHSASARLKDDIVFFMREEGGGALKFLVDSLNSTEWVDNTVKKDASLWSTEIEYDIQGGNNLFYFANAQYQAPLKVDISGYENWEMTGNPQHNIHSGEASVPSDPSPWSWHFSETFSTHVNQKQPLYAYIERDTVAVLCMDTIRLNGSEVASFGKVVVKIVHVIDLPTLDGVLFFTIVEQAGTPNEPSPDSRLTLGAPVASLVNGMNSSLYHLRVDSIDFTYSTAALAGTGAGIHSASARLKDDIVFFMREEGSALKFLVDSLNSTEWIDNTVKKDASLWSTEVAGGVSGQRPVFHFTNAQHQTPLKVDISGYEGWEMTGNPPHHSREASVPSGQGVQSWYFSDFYIYSIDQKQPLYAFLSPDTLAVLCVDTIRLNGNNEVASFGKVVVKIVNVNDFPTLDGVLFFTIVEQAGGSAGTLSPSSTAFSFPAAGNSQTLDVTSNLPWTAVSSAPAWLTVTPPSGNGNGTVNVTATAHTGSSPRTTTVTLTGGGIVHTISVTQATADAPSPVLTVSPGTVSLTAGSSSEDITVTSNTDWTAVSSASWLTVSPASGANDATVSATATANTGAARTATVTFTAGNITRTVSVEQAVAPVLTVSTALITLASAGGSASLAVTSNTGWTAAGSEPWLTVSPPSGTNNGTVSVTATAHTGATPRTATVTLTGGGLTHTVSVTQEATQQIVVEPAPPVTTGQEASIGVSLNVPTDEPFSVRFTLFLPAGFRLDVNATALAPDLASDYHLTIVAIGTDGWLFAIQPAVSMRAADETVNKELVHIAYTVDESVAKGNYEVTLNDVNLDLTDGTTIHQNEIKVTVAVTPAGAEEVDAAESVHYARGLLTVNTPAAERIEVYSVGGLLLYGAQKPSGTATFDLNSLPGGLLIVRGESGWAGKIVR